MAKNDQGRYTPVDGCPHSFERVVSDLLPKHMAELNASRSQAVSMVCFEQAGTKAVLAQQGLKADFPGCYLLLEDGHPIYVGISRKVFGRLSGHVQAKTHNTATLAYKMAAKWTGRKLSRAQAMQDGEFLRQFERAQTYLRSLSVAYVEIRDPYVRHVFEAYAAQELGTGEWNSFETH
jgi:predicted GIY-YIG superfamily endonuclease